MMKGKEGQDIVTGSNNAKLNERVGIRAEIPMAQNDALWSARSSRGINDGSRLLRCNRGIRSAFRNVHNVFELQGIEVDSADPIRQFTPALITLEEKRRPGMSNEIVI